MPPLATRVLDTQAIDLLTEWISHDLANFQTFAEWQIQYFGATDAPDAQPNADPDADGAPNSVEYLQGSNPRDGLDRWKVSVERVGNVVRLSFPCAANCRYDVQARSNLNDPNNWQLLKSVTSLTGSPPDPNAVVEDVIDGSTARYYRVRLFSQ